MLRDFWNRHMRRTRAVAIERQAEREQMNSTERHFAEESIGGIQADVFVREHVGDVPPERLPDEDEPPPN
jgi:hypothetical protein